MNNDNNLEETVRNFLVEQRTNSVAQWEKRKKPDIDIGSHKMGASSPNSLEEDNLEEGSFRYYMNKAIAADSRGDSGKRKYHLDSAKTALHALKTSEYPKHKELLDKYKEMRKGQKNSLEEEDSVEEAVTGHAKPNLGPNYRPKRNAYKDTLGALEMRRWGGNQGRSPSTYNTSQKLSEARVRSLAKVSKKKSEDKDTTSNKGKTDTGQTPDFVDFRPNKNELTNN
jgi:hypothetical protein